MTNKIKIDIISDVVCPWCIVGYKRLEKAMDELGVKDKFEIEWNPFELNPNIAPEGEDIIEHMSRKYGMSEEKSTQYQIDTKKTFDEIGFPFEFYKGKRIVSTKDAHILLHYAKEQGKQTELKLALFKANFGEKKDVSNKKVLEEIVKSIGLDTKEALSKLNDKDAIKNIEDKEAYWKNKGINAVPTMVFNNATSMNGAYPVETYKQVLTELLETKI